MYTKDDVAQHKAVNGNLVPLTDAERQAIAAEWNAAAPTLEQAQAIARVAIDAAAGAARARYITVAHGQEATYLLKDRQARDYKATGYLFAGLDAYPYVHAEARAMYGPTPSALQCQAAADAIITMADQWLAKGAQIEELRIGGKRTVADARDIDAARAASDAAVATLLAV